VTVVFCDVVGSTSLGESVDPEALQALLARYFERMKAIVENHGGTVEKFIGDAVMAVFGVPVVREDDALRAVRVAEEMQAALGELKLEGRIGVNTGEVVTGTPERLVAGDAVNVAARLQQAASPGQILLGAETHVLVADAVHVEPVEPLTLKGKSEPVAAWRLLDVIAGAPAYTRRLDGPFNVAPDGWLSGEDARALAGAPPRLRLPEPVVTAYAGLLWRWKVGRMPPGLVPYTMHPWAVANDRLKAAGWVPAHSNEETYVDATTGTPWSRLSPKRRQELALGAVAIATVTALAGTAVAIRRFRRRRS